MVDYLSNQSLVDISIILIDITYFNKQIEEWIKEYSTNDDLTNTIMYAIVL